MKLTTIDTPRINEKITAPELRVIDEHGKNIGVLPLADALALRRPGELDLIEVVPGAKPPVARLMSFDKYRYEREKQAKKERQAQKTAGLKQVQISARAQIHDLEVKVRQLEKFLDEGHQVEVRLRLRGREKANKDFARAKLEEFMRLVASEHKRVSEPKFSGSGLTLSIVRTKK